jgi:hypothetical protein
MGIFSKKKAAPTEKSEPKMDMMGQPVSDVPLGDAQPTAAQEPDFAFVTGKHWSKKFRASALTKGRAIAIGGGLLAVAAAAVLLTGHQAQVTKTKLPAASAPAAEAAPTSLSGSPTAAPLEVESASGSTVTATSPSLATSAASGTGAAMNAGAPGSAHPSMTVEQATQIFLRASQNAVQVTQVQPIKGADNLFAASYVVSGRSGTAWVDGNRRIVFAGSAVSEDGQVITPGSVVIASNAVNAATDGQPASPSATPGVKEKVEGVTQDALEPVMLRVINSAFGFLDAPKKRTAETVRVWAFFDPDSADSARFVKEVRSAIDAGRLEVFWIPTAFETPRSLARAAWISSQVGPVSALRKNAEGFDEQRRQGGAEMRGTIDLNMRASIEANTRLLGEMGAMQTPLVVFCSADGHPRRLYVPAVDQLTLVAKHCSPSIVKSN